MEGARPKELSQSYTKKQFAPDPPLKKNAAAKEARVMKPISQGNKSNVVKEHKGDNPKNISSNVPVNTDPPGTTESPLQASGYTEPLYLGPHVGTHSAPSPVPPYALFKNMFSQPPPQPTPLITTPEIARGTYGYSTPYPQQQSLPQQNWYLNDPEMCSPYQIEATDESVLEWEHDRGDYNMYNMLDSPEYQDDQEFGY